MVNKTQFKKVKQMAILEAILLVEVFKGISIIRYDNKNKIYRRTIFVSYPGRFIIVVIIPLIIILGVFIPQQLKRKRKKNSNKKKKNKKKDK